MYIAKCQILCSYVWTYACMHVSMYVCMYACMYVRDAPIWKFTDIPMTDIYTMKLPIPMPIPIMYTICQ